MHRSVRRRRLEGRTDYKARLALLKSGKPRLIIRKTARYIIAQIAESDMAQDKIIAGISSSALISKGWPKESRGSLKSLAASYLTGYLLGKTAKAKTKNTEFVLDIGMNRNIQKARIYAVLKGFIDAGCRVPHSAEALPDEATIASNKKTSSLLEKLKKEIK